MKILVTFLMQADEKNKRVKYPKNIESFFLLFPHQILYPP